MLVEIGSMTSLRAGQKIYDLLKEDDKVLFVFLEAGWFTDLENTLFLLRGLVGGFQQYAFVVSGHHLLE